MIGNEKTSQMNPLIYLSLSGRISNQGNEDSKINKNEGLKKNKSEDSTVSNFSRIPWVDGALGEFLEKKTG